MVLGDIGPQSSGHVGENIKGKTVVRETPSLTRNFQTENPNRQGKSRNSEEKIKKGVVLLDMKKAANKERRVRGRPADRCARHYSERQVKETREEKSNDKSDQRKWG